MTYEPTQYDIEDLHYLFSFTDEEKTYLEKLMKRDGVGLNGILHNLFKEYLSTLKKEGAELSQFCANFEYSEKECGFVDNISGDHIVVRMTSEGKWEVAVWAEELNNEGRPPFYRSHPYDKLWDAYKNVDFYMSSYRDMAQYPVPDYPIPDWAYSSGLLD